MWKEFVVAKNRLPLHQGMLSIQFCKLSKRICSTVVIMIGHVS